MTACRLCGGGSKRVAEYDLAQIQPQWRARVESTRVEIRKCSRHGSYFTADVPAPEALYKQYEYDAKAYFAQPGFDTAAKWRDKIKILERSVPPRGSVLDLGGGDGSFARTAAGAGFSSWLQELADVNKEELERAGVRWLDRGSADMKEGFDAVTLWDVYEHVWPHDALVAAARSSLKPDGKLIIEIPSPSHLVPLFLAAARVAKPVVRARLLAQICNFTHLQLMTPDEMKATLPRLGFRIREITTLSALSYSGEVYAKRFLPGLAAKLVGEVFDHPAARRILLGNNKTVVIASKN
jgi:2-polyprenyl-3-methyl-5-hydroxy-6-metoxy-1,4-benzoquinol methylase